MTKEWLAQLLAKNDIYNVVSAYVDLKRQGGNYFGRCPFHNEKTASFSVNTYGQYFKCFGCGAGGDAITFIRLIEKLEFMEAVRFLAAKSGMEVPTETDTEKSRADKQLRDGILKINVAAARFFFRALYSESGRVGLDYFHKRGLSDELIKTFGLGYCPPDLSLVRELQNEFSDFDINRSGLAYQKPEGWNETFAGRVIIPIIDIYGQVVAFGGRALGDDPAKYKNSLNSAAFNKSRTVFGINLLKKQRNIEHVILTEGYMDVIALYKAGFTTAVASMGTSLTKEQARLISRFTKEVYICFDGDGAGTDGTLRGLGILREEGLTVRVVSLPDGLDPDDFIKQRGRDAFSTCLKEAEPLVMYRIKTLAKKADLSKSDEKSDFTVAAVDIIRSIENTVEQEEYLRFLSRFTGYTLDSLNQQLRSGKTSDNVRTAFIPSASGSPREKAVEYILAAAAKGHIDIKNYIEIEPFLESEGARQLYETLISGYSASVLLAESEQAGEILDIISNSLLLGSPEQITEDCDRYYQLVRKENIKQTLAQLFAQINNCADADERERLLNRYKELQRKK